MPKERYTVTGPHEVWKVIDTKTGQVQDITGMGDLAEFDTWEAAEAHAEDANALQDEEE